MDDDVTTMDDDDAGIPCWLLEVDGAHARGFADRLDALGHGFLWWRRDDRASVFLADKPLEGDHVTRLDGVQVDQLGADLISIGALVCGAWAAAPPEPWRTQFGLFGEALENM